MSTAILDRPGCGFTFVTTEDLPEPPSRRLQDALSAGDAPAVLFALPSDEVAEGIKSVLRQSISHNKHANASARTQSRMTSLAINRHLAAGSCFLRDERYQSG